MIDFTSALLGRPTLASAMITKIYQFLRDESGATVIEIGVIVAGISLVIIAAAKRQGTKLNTKLQRSHG